MKLSVSPKEPKVDLEVDPDEIEALWRILAPPKPKQDTRPIGWFEHQSMRSSKPRM